MVKDDIEAVVKGDIESVVELVVKAVVVEEKILTWFFAWVSIELPKNQIVNDCTNTFT